MEPTKVGRALPVTAAEVWAAMPARLLPGRHYRRVDEADGWWVELRRELADDIADALADRPPPEPSSASLGTPFGADLARLVAELGGWDIADAAALIETDRLALEFIERWTVAAETRPEPAP